MSSCERGGGERKIGKEGITRGGRWDGGKNWQAEKSGRRAG